MKYIIEGTVSEVTVKNDKTVGFKIAGTEGYAIKQKGKKYNILCLKDQPVGKAYIFEQTVEFTTGSNNLSNLQTAISNGKKISVELDIEESTPIVLSTATISLLSE